MFSLHQFLQGTLMEILAACQGCTLQHASFYWSTGGLNFFCLVFLQNQLTSALFLQKTRWHLGNLSYHSRIEEKNKIKKSQKYLHDCVSDTGN